MKIFVVLTGLVAVAMARPSIYHLSPQSVQASAAASASASSSPQRLSLLQLEPGLLLEQDARAANTLEVHIGNAGREAARQRNQANARNSLGITRIISSPSLAPVGPDGRVIDTIEVSLAKAEHAAAHRNEHLRLANQDARAAAAEAQAQQQQLLSGPNSWQTATRQAQSLASINPTGASSISSAQVIESQHSSASRAAQQQALAAALARQAAQANGLPLVLGLDGQLLAASPLVLL